MTSTEPQIQTRKPTGRPAWPLYLVEGPEKSGKTYLAAQLTASRRFSRRFWVDWNEGAADEYAALAGADYEIAVHDGTFQSVANQIYAIHAYAKLQEEAGEEPVLLVIDSMTAEWDQLKDKANEIAMSSPAARRKLEKDPGADVPIPMHAWNTVGEKHGRLMRLLMTFPGVVVMTARAKEVAAIDENGRPKEGVKDYKVEAHKNLGYDASCVIRMSREVPPQVVGMRSVQHGVRPGVDAPKPLGNQTLESLTFDVILGGGQQPATRDVSPEPELTTRMPEEPKSEAQDTARQAREGLEGSTSGEKIETAVDPFEEGPERVKFTISMRTKLYEAGHDLTKLRKLREFVADPDRLGEGHHFVRDEVDPAITAAEAEQQLTSSDSAEVFDWEGAIEDAEREGDQESIQIYMDTLEAQRGANDRTTQIARAVLKRVSEKQQSML